MSKPKVIEKILSIDPNEIIADTNSALIERHDDAIGILKKYHSLESCIVCDNDSFNGDILLEQKKKNRKHIYDSLDKKTKDILDKIVCDNSLGNSDPFEIKKIVGAFITNGNPIDLIQLQLELKADVNSLGDEMIYALLHCFDGTNFFNYFDEHAQLVEKQPQLDSEELLFIENVISENVGKDMELSTGEQNFISLAFELLLARHSNKDYIIMDDPISSFDSVYKNKIAFCIIKFLEITRNNLSSLIIRI